MYTEIVTGPLKSIRCHHLPCCHHWPWGYFSGEPPKIRRLSQHSQGCSLNWPPAVLSLFLHTRRKTNQTQRQLQDPWQEGSKRVCFVLGWALTPIQSSSRQSPLEGTLSSPRTGCARRAAVSSPQVFFSAGGNAPAEIHASKGGADSRGRGHIYWEGRLQIWTAVQGPKAGLTERWWTVNRQVGLLGFTGYSGSEGLGWR